MNKLKLINSLRLNFKLYHAMIVILLAALTFGVLAIHMRRQEMLNKAKFHLVRETHAFEVFKLCKKDAKNCELYAEQYRNEILSLPKNMKNRRGFFTRLWEKRAKYAEIQAQSALDNALYHQNIRLKYKEIYNYPWKGNFSVKEEPKYIDEIQGIEEGEIHHFPLDEIQGNEKGSGRPE